MSALKAFLVVVLHIAVLTGVVWAGNRSAQQEQGLPGLWWDDRAWTPIVVPQGTMFCTVSDSTHMKCLAIPPGSLLILPVPQEDHEDR